MMTFKQYVAEVVGKPLIDVDTIKNDCAFFLKESDGGILLRGINDPGSQFGHIMLDGKEYPIFKKTVRADRKPLSTDPQIHKAIDNWFDETFDMKARSNTLFCFGLGGWGNTSSYGVRYLILPIGKFRYVWSQTVSDLFDDVITKKFSAGEGKKFRDSFLDDKGEPDLDKLAAEMSKLGYQTDELDIAVHEGNEIMVECREYYALPCPSSTWLNIMRKELLV